MANNEINNTLWKIADELRGSMDASKYKDYILSFIFYKFLSENIINDFNDKNPSDDYIEVYNEEPEELKQERIESVGYFIKPEYLFKEFASRASNDNFFIDDLTDALGEVERSALGQESEEEFEGLFSDLNLNSSDLGGDRDEQNENVGKILKALDSIDFELDNDDTDVIGDAYEYLIGQFAGDSGKRAGEFYTPQHVAKILTKIIVNEKDDVRTIYDPTCGSGSLLLRTVREFNKNNKERVFVYGQEKNNSTYNLSRMNMLIHGLPYDHFTIVQGDTLTKPSFMDMKFDAIVANPPFSATWEPDKVDKNADARFRPFTKLAPKTKADFAFVQHMLYMLEEEGTAATLLPHGPLFRGAAEKAIREKLLEDSNIYAVIGLPANIFTSTSIPTIILVLKKCNEDKKVLFIDASKEFKKVKKTNELEDKHIDKIIDAYRNRDNVNDNEQYDKFARLVDLEEIKENDYNLNIPRYIDTFEEEEEIDIKQVKKEIKDIMKEIAELDKEIESYEKQLYNTQTGKMEYED